MSSHVDVDAKLQTIVAMRRQEDNGYQVTDYLAQIPAAAVVEGAVDEDCRQVMAKWCVDIAEFCNYSRETACIALNILDRFMASDGGRGILLDRNQFQLASMTALYTAVKIHEHEAMDPNLVSTLSRGAHSPEAVEAMEFRMLSAIQWKFNPPTAMSFVRNMLDLVPDHLMGSSERETLLDLTQLQVDLASTEYDFCQCPASYIALSSLLNAMESVTTDGAFYSNFEETMSGAAQIDLGVIRNIRISLYESVNGTEPMDMQVSPPVEEDEKLMETFGNSSQECIYSSPRSVCD